MRKFADVLITAFLIPVSPAVLGVGAVVLMAVKAAALTLNSVEYLIDYDFAGEQLLH